MNVVAKIKAAERAGIDVKPVRRASNVRVLAVLPRASEICCDGSRAIRSKLPLAFRAIGITAVVNRHRFASMSSSVDGVDDRQYAWGITLVKPNNAACIIYFPCHSSGMAKKIDLEKLRKRLNLTQAALAEHLGVHQSTIARIEDGKRSPSGPVQRLLEQLMAESMKRDAA